MQLADSFLLKKKKTPYSPCFSQTVSTLVTYIPWQVLIQLLNILICTVHFSLFMFCIELFLLNCHVNMCHKSLCSRLSKKLHWNHRITLLCLTNWFWYFPVVYLLFCPCHVLYVWIGTAISLCYCWPAAGGSGQEISTNMDSDPLEQPTSTRAVRLQPFSHCLSSTCPLWSNLDKEKDQQKTDPRHI